MTRRRSDGWRVERCTASATSLLESWPPAGEDDTAVVRAGRVSGRAALVLGSTQDDAPIDGARAARVGVDIIRRTTGGGAVLVAPEAQVWLDVWLPRHHRLWDDDVITAAAWLGDAWAAALGSLGAGSLVVRRGPSTGAVMSDVVCFAGIGPGELYIEDGPSHRTKVMGLAQRRTRRGARFHTTAPLAWDPGPLLDLLGAAPPDEQVAPLRDAAVGQRALLRSLSGVSDVELIGAVEDAVIAALP